MAPRASQEIVIGAGIGGGSMACRLAQSDAGVLGGEGSWAGAETGCPMDYRAWGAIEIARTDAEWQERLARASQEAPGIRTSLVAAREGATGAPHYPDDRRVEMRGA